MYRTIDAALIRATAHPQKFTDPPWPDLTGDDAADQEQRRNWLRHVWALPGVAEAIEVASPLLARRVSDVCAGKIDKPRQVRRAVVSVMRYLLRMRHRATPFGLFAGVAPARLGNTLRLHWGEEHSPVAGADALWLAEVITGLETCPELLRRLPVVTDSTCYVRGDRLVVPCQRSPRPATGSPTASEMSLRNTRAVQTVLAAAVAPITVAELAARLATAYPQSPAEVIDRLLTELVTRHVLISSLHPPMTVTDPLGHLIDELEKAEAGTIPAVASTLRALGEIHRSLSRHSHGSDSLRRTLRSPTADRMKALTDVAEQPLTVNLRLDCRLELPHTVAREAEKAVAALAALSPFPSGAPAWQDYHVRFLEHYGPGALVPVRDLVDPDVGLGLPAGYRSSLIRPTAPRLTDRDTRLLALAQQAALDGAEEITLDDQSLARLSHKDDLQLPAHLELCFRLHAPNQDAVERGGFELVVAGLATGVGTITGRFLHLLEDEDRTRFHAAYAQSPTLAAGALPAQVSAPPLRTRTENVARAPQLLPTAISLAEHADSSPGLALDDLLVSADPHRMFLVSRTTGGAVEPAVLNAVEPTTYTHPLARFLCELPRATAAVLAPFSWGAARQLPFQPRIRYGRTVLSPARWRLDASDFPGARATWPGWTERLSELRQRLRLPNAVFLGSDDRRIFLDLDEPSHLHLLRSHLETTGQATLQEAPALTAYGWLDGRAHELVLPMTTTTPADAATAPRRATPVALRRDHGHLPGHSTWLYAKIYGHPERHPEFLTRHLPGFLAAWDSPPEWWFVPYRDPDPHLRLRLRLPHPDDWGAAVQRLGTWVAYLRRQGLARDLDLSTYRPETGRYGTGPAMDAAERVFITDSAAVIAQLTQTHATGTDAFHRQALTAASLVDLTTAFTGSTPAAARWLTENVSRSAAPTLARHIRQQAILLTDPRTKNDTLHFLPCGDQIRHHWEQRRTALTAYRARLTEAGDTAPETVLASLLHMHHIRMAGIDEECERTCHRLARAAALAWTVQQEGAQP
ncbi:lantibiotic dehydratase [Streptomyces aidingensis]|uniref:Thiopeptide-type bacteriocin biosynthesis domain-containing protein n=1 Tax=Streptomyces aidingensis TaxID=910347 RepID=A0A1I1K9J5_9ACTN|nr:lantibiotic dehydratase [Streptomyces aidingensis]SFC57191.1 thiopeptide-type bacteriocin biosynthesis domain-containing protein [Streptomyces aidingensis]